MSWSSKLLFQCRYSSLSIEAVVVQVLPIPPPASIAAMGTLKVQLRLANGYCHTKGCSIGKWVAAHGYDSIGTLYLCGSAVN